MLRIFAVLLVSATMGACVDRSVSVTLPSALEVGTPETVYAATTRGQNPDGTFNADRGDGLRFLEMTVSIPPSHTPGELDFSYGNPNPEKQFVLAGVDEFAGPKDLAQRLRGEDDVTIFVHGYNSTHTETAFRAAQLAHDVEIPG